MKNETLLWRPRRTLVATLLSLSMALPGVSQALALYDASAFLDLSLTEVRNTVNAGSLTGLSITGFADVFEQDISTFGDGVATATGDASVDAADPGNLEVGEGISLSAMASGSAGPLGNVDSAYITDGFLDLLNTSATDSFELDFQLSYGLAATAGADTPAFENAFALANVGVFVDSLGAIVEQFLDFDTLFAPGTDQVSQTEVSFTVTLEPNGTDTISLLADAQGGAFADVPPTAVPVPGVLALLSVGLLGMIGCHQQRSTLS